MAKAREKEFAKKYREERAYALDLEKQNEKLITLYEQRLADLTWEYIKLKSETSKDGES